MRSTISRVLYRMIIYLGFALPQTSIDPPKSTTGSRIALCSVFLRMGFTLTASVTESAVVSYTAFSPLSGKSPDGNFLLHFP